MWMERGEQILEGQLKAALEEAIALPDSPEREELFQFLQQMHKTVGSFPTMPENVK